MDDLIEKTELVGGLQTLRKEMKKASNTRSSGSEGGREKRLGGREVAVKKEEEDEVVAVVKEEEEEEQKKIGKAKKRKPLGLPPNRRPRKRRYGKGNGDLEQLGREGLGERCWLYERGGSFGAATETCVAV